MKQNNNNPLISYLLITYNSDIHFPDIIENLKKFTKPLNEIIIVDNNSENIDYLKAYRVKYNTKNVFFTSAVNQGLKLINKGSKYIILVNPDVRINKNTIEKLLSDSKDYNAGIAGTILLNSNLLVQHAGGQEYDLKKLDPLEMDNHSHLHDGDKLKNIINNYPKKVQWVTGAFFMITKEAFAKLGILDTNLKHYKSDMEYCLRAINNNINIICSSAVCLHYHKKSGRKGRGTVNKLFTKIKFRIIRKYFELIIK